MREQLEAIYEKGLKPIARILTAPFIAPTAIRRGIEKLASYKNYGELGNYKYQAESEGVIAESILYGASGIMLSCIGLSESVRNFSEGRTLEGFTSLIPAATNVISGAYEIYKLNKRDAKRQSLLDDIEELENRQKK